MCIVHNFQILCIFTYEYFTNKNKISLKNSFNVVNENIERYKSEFD